YGLDKPALRITFSSYASENTAETSAGEDTILSVAFGKTEGDVVYVRLESEPYVVAIPRVFPDGQTIFDAISSDPVYWEDLTIYKFKPDDIVTLNITREGQTISLERPAGGGPWKLKQGLGAFNQSTLQSLVNTLATLNAFRSLGTSTSGLGFDKPALMIAFTTAAGQTGKLTIGARDAEEGAWTAEAEGRAGAFLVSGPDYEGLSTVLTAPAEPATSPTVSPVPPNVAP
ncbi:MAG TPA: DUF4340 domain-containing protein, partial [Chthoniobacteraceae bacterium]|nr:DUF4340 domain-containing protein [Chthoniobacteraceae bacterium]